MVSTIDGKTDLFSHSRPNIAYVIGLVSQFTHTLMNCHMEAMTHILRHLKHTPVKNLLFEKHGHCHIEAYIDVDWGGSLTNRHPTSSYYTLVARNLVTRRSKKQVVSRSSAEA